MDVNHFLIVFCITGIVVISLHELFLYLKFNSEIKKIRIDISKIGKCEHCIGKNHKINDVGNKKEDEKCPPSCLHKICRKLGYCVCIVKNVRGWFEARKQSDDMDDESNSLEDK